MNTNTIALDALKAAYITMQHMGNAAFLNNMDAVDEDEDAEHDAAFEAVRAAIAALEAEPQPTIPEGWGFCSADFSLQASGVSEFGGVMLIRTGADRADWHLLTEVQKEEVALYVSGTGRTVAEAIASAAKNCTPLPSTPPKD